MSSACEFCKIVGGRAPAEVIASSSQALAFFPLHPATVGHTLVIPRVHVATIWDVDANTLQAVIELARTVSKSARIALNPDGLNLINSSGAAATQTVLHLHFHVVPRWRDDAIGNIWPPPKTEPDFVRSEIADQMRRAFAVLPNDQ